MAFKANNGELSLKNVLSKNQEIIVAHICEILDLNKVKWMLAGSANLRLQGIVIPETEIDIVTDKNGAYIFEELFAEFVTHPVLFEEKEKHYRSHFGKFNIEGYQINVMGDVEIFDHRNETWTSKLDFSKIVFVHLDGQNIPCVKLAYELEVYRSEGRMDKAQAIINHFVDKFS